MVTASPAAGTLRLGQAAGSDQRIVRIATELRPRAWRLGTRLAAHAEQQAHRNKQGAQKLASWPHDIDPLWDSASPILVGRSLVAKWAGLPSRSVYGRPASTYLLTAILAWMSNGRIGMRGASVTTSLTQRASPALKYEVSFALRRCVEAVLLLPGGCVGETRQLEYDP